MLHDFTITVSQKSNYEDDCSEAIVKCVQKFMNGQRIELGRGDRLSLNFTVGPVQSEDYICCIGGEQVPYFRNDYFSNIVLESETLLKKFLNSPEDSKALFITGSGTASMEAAVVNIFSKTDKLMVINGGTFGDRFVSICETYGFDYIEVKVPFGVEITMEDLESAYTSDVTGLLINVDETSSGVLYDMEIISDFCKKNELILIADIISSFLADDNDMKRYNVDTYIIGSQKALGCQPGVSVLVLSGRAVQRIKDNNPVCFYLDLKKSLKDSERGQTPFTPAVGIIRQIHARLMQIDRCGGVKYEMDRIRNNASFVRENMKKMPFRRVTMHSSNAVTAYYSNEIPVKKMIQLMKDKYDIWICPNGGAYADSVFRIGHIGSIGIEENRYMLDCLAKVVEELRTSMGSQKDCAE